MSLNASELASQMFEAFRASYLKSGQKLKTMLKQSQKKLAENFVLIEKLAATG